MTTAPVTVDPVVVSPLSPAKIAVNDPSTIITALATVSAVIANVWPDPRAGGRLG